VEPDTSTSVLFNLLKRSTLDTNQVDSINQLRYRLNAAGELELISATVDSPLTKAHLVFQ
jgi:hypothetical protein